MNLSKTVKNLLLINVIVFALMSFNIFPLFQDCVLYSLDSSHFSTYQFFTYMFLHASFTHIILNMFGLITFGPEIENFFGEKKFLVFYLICGVIGGLLHVLCSTSPVVGASAAIWGLMLVYALVNPNRVLHLYFFIPVKAKWIIGAFFFIEFFLAITNASDGISHYGHVGGALSGALFFFLSKRKLIK